MHNVIQELIKVKGNQVAPAELEGLLLEHPAISDAAVVGVTMSVSSLPLPYSLPSRRPILTTPHRSGEELPRGYVVLQTGQSTSPKEIADWLAQRVARHKRLAGGVAIVNEIAKNPSGKILRKALRERAKEEVGDRDARRESRL